MINKRLNNKAFTLIELLAVIIILGVLMIVAIPQVTKYINNTRRDAFGDTALAYIDAARYSILSDEYDKKLPAENDHSVCIKFKWIKVDKGTTSAFGKPIKLEESFVRVKKNSTGQIVYSVYMVDEDGYATNGEVTEEKLSTTEEKRVNIKTGNPAGTCINADNVAASVQEVTMSYALS